MRMVISTPKNYEPNAKILEKAREMGGEIIFVRDPKKAVEEADVIYTDVWTSMGQEDERSRRLADFRGYQVSDDLLKLSKDDVVVMHCMPAHRGEEITDEVIEGKHSIIFDQAENRLHAQKAVLLKLMGKEDEIY